MKTLVIYYSLDGNTRCMAEEMAQAIGADTMELKPVKGMPKSLVARILAGGFQVMTKKTPALLPLTRDPAEYDLLILGSPVWAGCYAPAWRSFFSQVSLSGKRLALFLCHGGGKGDAFGKMRAALAGNEILAETDFCSPLKENTEEAKARAAAWAREAAQGQAS